nr:PIN domain-containing protein [Dyadobacter fermentans]
MAKELVLVDTSILIDFFRKSDKANSRLMKLVTGDAHFCISAITEFEIYTGTTKSDRLLGGLFVQNPGLGIRQRGRSHGCRHQQDPQEAKQINRHGRSFHSRYGSSLQLAANNVECEAFRTSR